MSANGLVSVYVFIVREPRALLGADGVLDFGGVLFLGGEDRRGGLVAGDVGGVPAHELGGVVDGAAVHGGLLLVVLGHEAGLLVMGGVGVVLLVGGGVCVVLLGAGLGGQAAAAPGGGSLVVGVAEDVKRSDAGLVCRRHAGEVCRSLAVEVHGVSLLGSCSSCSSCSAWSARGRRGLGALFADGREGPAAEVDDGHGLEQRLPPELVCAGVGVVVVVVVVARRVGVVDVVLEVEDLLGGGRGLLGGIEHLGRRGRVGGRTVRGRGVGKGSGRTSGRVLRGLLHGGGLRGLHGGGPEDGGGCLLGACHAFVESGFPLFAFYRRGKGGLFWDCLRNVLKVAKTR